MSNLVEVKGDTFILCTFPFMYGGRPLVLDSGNTLGQALENLADYADEDETLCLCRVNKWVMDMADGEFIPTKFTTVFQITAYDLDALHDEEDDDS